MLKSSYNTTSSVIKKLIEFYIPALVNNSKRGRSIAYEEYLTILRKKT